MMIRTTTTFKSILGVSIATAFSVAASGGSAGSVVITQVEERAFFGLWLLADDAQQSFAHSQVIANHDVSAVEVFSDESIADADVVYLSPALTELNLSADEIDALVNFVTDGGRLVLPADNGHDDWAGAFAELAARFEVTWGDSFVQGIAVCVVEDFDNPIIDGPNGLIESFSSASPNDNLSSTNPDFRVLGTWNDEGPPAAGYLEHGEGAVVFLTDFNTWDDDMWFDFDNLNFFLNLFDFPACLGDFDGDDVVGATDLIVLLGNWGKCAECPGDINGDGVVGTADLLELLGAWGPCP